jgi:squalene-hopene/tetraprenyl-beta-curcumene cyclase
VTAGTLEKATESLLAERNAAGFWEGALSSSALSTATALYALHLMDRHKYFVEIKNALSWLAEHQNEDGGFGDTVRSKSNISTTALCWAAFSVEETNRFVETVEKLESCLKGMAGGLEVKILSEAIRKRYGKDKTFSIPILSMLALSGRLGDSKEVWDEIPALPYEIAVLPKKLFAVFRMPVVSYALPALIAMGQLRAFKKPSSNPVARLLRFLCRKRSSSVLRKIQPSSGGYLEAIPLTSFVLMSLAAVNQNEGEVASNAARFIKNSLREDNSWAIDSNLSTWLTTLSVNALGPREDEVNEKTLNWLLKQQFQKTHAYTGAAPGGWGWTDLPGSVPDADDTAGALLALRQLGPKNPEVIKAADKGARWLLGLQNNDGGLPTFCKGWGHLPFDRSGSDLTAHAIAAWTIWYEDMSEKTKLSITLALPKALTYLREQQSEEGSWNPLWFGDQNREDETNPIYGTARVLMALNKLDEDKHPVATLKEKGKKYLLSQKDNQGSWGNLEQTALAVTALSAYPDFNPESSLKWIEDHLDDAPAPIGLYFAKLWYFEKLYPKIFALQALNSQVRV